MAKIIMVKIQVSCLLFLKKSVLYYHGTPNKAECGCFRGVSMFRLPQCVGFPSEVPHGEAPGSA